MFDWLIRTAAKVVETEEEASAWRAASLRFLDGRLPLPSKFYPSQSEVAYARKRLTETREWVEKIEDDRMRTECRSWCDYSETRINEAQHELDTKESAKRQERYREETAQKDARVRDILRNVKKP